jgi:hypothetical protein
MSVLAWRITLIVAAFLVPLAVGTVGFIVVERYPFLRRVLHGRDHRGDVGYSEIRPLSTIGRAFTFF